MHRSQEIVRQALVFLAEKGRVTDDEIGAMLGKSRQTGWAKRNGDKPHGSRITFDDIDLLAAGMGVDKTVFLMERDSLERWYERSRWRGPKRPVVLIDLTECAPSELNREPAGSHVHAGQGSLFDGWDSGGSSVPPRVVIDLTREPPVRVLPQASGF